MNPNISLSSNWGLCNINDEEQSHITIYCMPVMNLREVGETFLTLFISCRGSQLAFDHLLSNIWWLIASKGSLMIGKNLQTSEEISSLVSPPSTPPWPSPARNPDISRKVLLLFLLVLTNLITFFFCYLFLSRVQGKNMYKLQNML